MTNFHLSVPLVLASTSQIREKILTDLGLAVTIIHPEFDEATARQGFASLPIPQQALELARGKAASVNHIHPDWLVIGADQICESEGRIFSKPGNAERAADQLAALQGKTHYQHTACVLMRQGKVVWETVETAALTMRPLSREDIAAYIRLDQPLHCCGAYAYELHGKHLFSEVQGCDDVIFGLPALKLLAALYRLGYLNLTEQVG